jgi:hypothetical protein
VRRYAAAGDGISYDFFRGVIVTQSWRLADFFNDLRPRVTLPVQSFGSTQLNCPSRVASTIKAKTSRWITLGFHVTRAFIESLCHFQLELDVDQYVFSRESDSTSLVAHDC